MVQKWNSIVTPRDVVYYLGDLGLGSHQRLAPLIKELNGAKIMIRGNHDKLPADIYKEKLGFLEVYNHLDLHGIWLSHYPYYNSALDRGSNSNKQLHREGYSWLLCGHVHKAWRIKKRQFNVGVDVNDYFPVSMEEVREEIFIYEEENEE